MAETCPPSLEALAARIDAQSALADERDRRYTELRAADQLAVDAALKTANTRLDGMNELRAQIDKERGTYATKEALATLDKEVTRFAGQRSGVAILWGALLAVSTLVIAYLALRGVPPPK